MFALVILVNGLVCVTCVKYDNVTVEPYARQLHGFKLEHPKTIGLMTTSSGEGAEIRDTVQLNSDQFASQLHLDLQTHFDRERVPERVVHAKGTAAFGYFEVTNDVSNYTSADVFNGIGKMTPVVARFSSSMPSIGGSDLIRDIRGMSIKFYTQEGNLDLLCIHHPVYLYKDPINFIALVHSFKRNPRTSVEDFTAIWDFVTLRPNTFHTFLWTLSDYGIPTGFRRMDAFPIHTYELSNKNGKRFYVKFNFRTEQGLSNLTSAQAAAIQSRDLDFFVRDLYNAVESGNHPSWRVEIDVLTVDDLKNLDYDPFDVTRMWKEGTYRRVQIGRLTLNKMPDNAFRVAELSAFGPGNLVPGIPGPVDLMFKARRLFYRDTQNYRLGANHHKIDVNLPLYAKTYNRDGKAPDRENMRDVPNYYPNSFSGPMPYVDETRPERKLLVLERHAVDLQPSADFYNNILQNDAQRQRLVDNAVFSLVSVTPPILERAVKFMYLIDRDLGKRVEIGLKAALLAARANESG